MNDYYTQLAQAIIHSQEELIGSVAWSQAANVQGLSVDHDLVTISAPNQEEVINNLVGQYRVIFGEAAVEVCKLAARRLSQGNSTETLPSVLR